jgi:hypothetical protein
MERATQLDKHLFEQIKENNSYFNIIQHLDLSKFEVLQIVKEWYVNGMYEDILQDEDGTDLEEIINDLIEINNK